MSEWYETLAGLQDRAWDGLAAACAEGSHSLHLCALATTGLGGAAEARMVALRDADRDAGGLTVQTDLASRKVAELEANPLATLLFWWPDASLQIRARARVTVESGATLDPDWAALPQESRRNYGGRPPPSTPMPAAGDYRETAERDRFGRLVAELTGLDLVHLGSFHRRAEYTRDDGFEGQWLAP